MSAQNQIQQVKQTGNRQEEKAIHDPHRIHRRDEQVDGTPTGHQSDSHQHESYLAVERFVFNEENQQGDRRQQEG